LTEKDLSMTEQTAVETRTIHIPSGRNTLEGDLTVPEAATGVVLFAHGSGSSRFSPRNRYVARVLQKSGLATLLMDLLTSEEEFLDARTAALRFDIDLLARRLILATWWLVDEPLTAKLPIGYFGASTGAAAALVAAASIPDVAAAIVSRGGRPDFAGALLHRVVAPTLLIAGSEDRTVLELNRKALAELPGEKDLKIVPGASHLFEEPGALETVAELARYWFTLYLGRASQHKRAA
jgi:dienelactone hydrolase